MYIIVFTIDALHQKPIGIDIETSSTPPKNKQIKMDENNHIQMRMFGKRVLLMNAFVRLLRANFINIVKPLLN